MPGFFFAIVIFGDRVKERLWSLFRYVRLIIT